MLLNYIRALGFHREKQRAILRQNFKRSEGGGWAELVSSHHYKQNPNYSENRFAQTTAFLFQLTLSEVLEFSASSTIITLKLKNQAKKKKKLSEETFRFD